MLACAEQNVVVKTASDKQVAVQALYDIVS